MACRLARRRRSGDNTRSLYVVPASSADRQRQPDVLPLLGQQSERNHPRCAGARHIRALLLCSPLSTWFMWLAMMYAYVADHRHPSFSAVRNGSGPASTFLVHLLPQIIYPAVPDVPRGSYRVHSCSSGAGGSACSTGTETRERGPQDCLDANCTFIRVTISAQSDPEVLYW